jgi:pullulanase/glycogen debranching enzyme
MYFSKPRFAPWLVLILCTLLLTPVVGHASDDASLKKGLYSSFNRIARDYHSLDLAMADGTGQDAVLARQDAGIIDFKRLLGRVDSHEQMGLVFDELRAFGYRVRNKSEAFAFQEGLKNVEERLDYLIRTENPSFSRFSPVVERLSKEFTQAHAQLDSSNIATRIASAARGTEEPRALAQAPRNTAKLGAHVVAGKTSFAVYAPAATEVVLHLFEKAQDKTGKKYAMKKDASGIWSTRLDGALYGKFYGYTVDGPKGNGHLFDKTRLLSDPYAYANVDHDGKSVVVDRSYQWKNTNFKRPAAKDAIVYEMHVKDFTAHKSSGVKANLRGKYLGMLEGKGTNKVLGHLKDLGVNVIELMPIHEFDNNFAGVVNHWGYMTSHFFAPECSYASGKNGQAVKELKALIDGLHGEGFAVVLDVVYNHTSEGNHEGMPLNLKGFDNPGYYRLMPDNKNYYWNGTGCGNEVRTENPMTSQLIVDSLKYWVTEYKVDGFRFDLGTIIDKKTMQRIIDELPKDIILTAEPWAADWNRNQWGKSDFRNTRLAKWNDDYRETMRGLVNGQVDRNNLMTVMAGSCFWWSAKPTESLNYIEAHDGYTLADLFGGNKKKTKLAAIALLTSQGMPMIHAGQEFDRSKGGNHNSYDQDNDVNYIDWTVKEKNRDVFELYKGLISLRLKYPNFRHATALNNQSVAWIQPANGKALGMILKGKPEFVVLLNGDPHNWVEFKLEPGSWTVVCNGDKISDKGLGTAIGDYKVPPTTGVILKR